MMVGWVGDKWAGGWENWGGMTAGGWECWEIR